MIDKLQMKTNKVKELQDEARALRDEISEMQRVLKIVNNSKNGIYKSNKKDNQSNIKRQS